MISPKRTLLAILVASLGASSAVGLAACSEDDITSGDADDQVSVSLRDFDISPERIKVTAGEVKFEVTNEGDRVHEFAIRTPSGVERTGEIEPGESDSLTVDLPEGTHRVFDPLRDYQDRGMTARVIAVENDGTVTERTVERTVIDEEPDVDVPEVQEPEVQEPEVQQAPPPRPPPPPPPATVTQVVPAPQEESTTTP